MSIKKDYTLTKDGLGDLYYGIQLDWDYNERTVDISMPGYIKKKNAGGWARHEVLDPNVSLLTRAKKIGTEAQALLPPKKLPKLNGKGTCTRPLGQLQGDTQG